VIFGFASKIALFRKLQNRVSMRFFFSGILLLLFLASSCQQQTNQETKSEVEAAALQGLDSLNYRIDTLSRNLLCALPEPCVYIELERLLIEDTGKVAQRLNKMIEKALITSNLTQDTSYVSYESMAQSLIDEYRQLSKEEPSYRRNWEMMQDLNPYLNQIGLFGLSAYYYSYTGGAHGNLYVSTHLFRLKDGVQLNLDSLLLPEQKENLVKIAALQFKEQMEIKDEQSLAEAGYWFEEGFFLPLNFTLTEEGLEFIYNTYEIAPYSEGVIRLKLSWPDFAPLIKPQYRLFKAASA
jgi:hypothetical protein